MTAVLLAALVVSVIQLLSTLSEDPSVPPTDPTVNAKTVGDLYNIQKEAAADEAAKVSAAAAADQAAVDAKATTEHVNATMKASLKRPFFVQDANGAIVIVMPDSSDLGFHIFVPDPATTPLDSAPVPAPAPPAPEPAPVPPPVTPEPTPPPVTPEPTPPPPVV